MSEKKGCGCCSFTVGCFFGMVLLVAVVIGGGYLVTARSGFVFDQGLKYAYPQVRPYIERTLPDEWEAGQKAQIMQRIDRDVGDYLKLPSADRRIVREKVKGMMTTWGDPLIDKEVQLREVEALIQELKNKQT